MAAADNKRRNYLRVTPSPGEPVKIYFQKPPEFRILSKYANVRDISAGGIGVVFEGCGEIFSKEMTLDFKLLVPEEGGCSLTGIVKYASGNVCGIEFASSEYEIRKIARYIYRRELEMLGLDEYKWQAKAPDYRMEIEKEEKKLPAGPVKTDTAGLGKKKKVLIIERSQDTANDFSDFFSCQEFDTEVAGTILEGIQKAAESRPDLILIDSHCAYSDGQHAVRYLKGHPAVCSIPVFMLAPDKGEEGILLAMKAGAEAYIVKEMERDFIIKRIRDFLLSSRPDSLED
ncbi:MAG: response regulator [Nitrospiraceae bacterium]|nr:response regulator [Nitrospiraceae bacterium]